MKKLMKITSVAMAGLMLVSTMPVASAATKTTVAKPTVTVENAAKGVKISWKKAKNAKKYVVQRRISTECKYTTVKTIKNGKAGSFVDKKAKTGKSYTYKVTAYNGNASASSKEQAIVRLKTPSIDVYASTGVVVSSYSYNDGADSYEVYRAKVNNGKTGKFKKIGTIEDVWDVYTDDDFSCATLKYKIRGVNGKSKSAFSKVVKIDYVQAPSPISTISLNFDGINIIWPSIKDVQGYKIYRSVDGGEAQLVDDLTVDECDAYKLVSIPEMVSELVPEVSGVAVYSYKDTNVENGKKYQYTMEAYYSNGKVSSSENSVFPAVEFQDYAFAVKAGETNNEFSKYLPLINGTIEDVLGKGITYSLTMTTEDEAIATVSSDYKITGVSAGKTNLVVSVTIAYEAVNDTITVTLPILVTEVTTS